MPRKKSNLCRQCAEKPVKYRGVCAGCYCIARRRIDKGEATDEQLVQLGWWLQPLKTGRPSKGGEAMRKLLGK